MHVHASQFNPNAQMNAIYAARAEAGMAAARTRRKLIFSASALANEVDGETDCVVSLSGPIKSTGQSERIRWEQAKPSDRRREQSFLGLGITRRRSRLWRGGRDDSPKEEEFAESARQTLPTFLIACEGLRVARSCNLTSVYPTAERIEFRPRPAGPPGAILAEPCKSL